MSKKLIFGASGLVGSAFMRRHPSAIGLTSKDVNCAIMEEVAEWFSNNELLFNEEVDVYLCMGQVSGIKSQNNLTMLVHNTYMILNILLALLSKHKKGKIVYFSSSCVYPKNRRHNLKESDLLTGPIEYSNEGYALAKIIGTKYIEYLNKISYFTVVPPNLCGPNDQWDLEKAHVLQAMIKKIIEAKETGISSLEFNGCGDIRREYMHVDDLVDGVEYLLNLSRHVENSTLPRTINIGTGVDTSLEIILSGIIKKVGYEGDYKFIGTHKGAFKKVLDCSLINNLGWFPKKSKTMSDIIAIMIEEYYNVHKK